MMLRLLRGFAIAVAIAGLIDPAWTSTRKTQPIVSVVAADSEEARALALRVAGQLRERFTVLEAPFAAAAATILVGDQLPTDAGTLAGRVFAVVPDPTIGRLTLEAVDAPLRAQLDTRVPVQVRVRRSGTASRRVEIALRQGNVLIDRVVREAADTHQDIDVTITFTPSSTGVATLRVTAEAEGARPASADLVVDIHEARRAILFFDPRPSWMSTFVRRALERDARFSVASRVVTSHDISTEAGGPPASLGDPDALVRFDAIVVGAPEALGTRDVAGLEAHLRRRGGSVILLFDRRATGAFERLTQVGEWQAASLRSGVAIQRAASDSTALRASEILWPASLPAGARAIARAAASDAATSRPVVWSSAVGAGHLYVSGALDAWRSRDPATSSFDEFWRALIADAAESAAAPIDVALTQHTLRPGEITDVTATLREPSLTALAAGEAVRSSVTATLAGENVDHVLRLWPDGPVGSFRGTFRAPSAAGAYRIAVASQDARGEAAFVVVPDATRATAEEQDLIAAWTHARGGTVLPASRLSELPGLLDATLSPTDRRMTWHPMRSPWWILPFTLALALEWLLRRRRGLK